MVQPPYTGEGDEINSLRFMNVSSDRHGWLKVQENTLTAESLSQPWHWRRRLCGEERKYIDRKVPIPAVALAQETLRRRKIKGLKFIARQGQFSNEALKNIIQSVNSTFFRSSTAIAKRIL
jgi:hypothetical protein